jgi:hypothetical protein
MPLAVDVDSYDDDGAVDVTWDSTGVSGTFYAWRIYRRPVGASTWDLVYETVDNVPSYSIDDYQAEANVPQEWAKTQVTVAFVGAPQVEGTYEVVTDTPVGTHYWLVHPTTAAFNTRLEHVTAHSESDNYEQATIPLIDRGYHVEQGSNFGETGSLTAELTDRTEGTARQQRQKVELLKASNSEVFLRTPFGDVLQVALGQLSFDRDAGVGLREHGTLTIPYTEVT